MQICMYILNYLGGKAMAWASNRVNFSLHTQINITATVGTVDLQIQKDK